MERVLGGNRARDLRQYVLRTSRRLRIYDVNKAL